MIAQVVGEVVLGWLLADLLSGLFHWAQDRAISERAPFLGRFLVYYSRLHHREPLAFVSGSFAWRNGSTFAFAGVVGLALVFSFGWSVTVGATIVGGALSTQVHYWAHRPGLAPRIVRVLQETGALQSPKHHAGHHRPPQLTRYCILTDWLNPILDALGVWARLERLARIA